jgi:hypothetical protein
MDVPNQGTPGEPTAHLHFIKDVPHGQANPHGGGGSPLLAWHGGSVLHSTIVQAIFWGTSWTNATFANDKVTGLTAFYGGVGGSGYLRTNIEYTDGSGPVGTGVTNLVSVTDPSAGPSHAPKTSAILAEVCSRITSPVSNGYYPVYTDLPRGHAGYCAWHSAGNCGGVPVQFAFFFILDGDPGCDPGSNVANQSQGLAALANVSGHELSEAVTDPRLNAWYDASGAENADKCAWTFGSTVSFGGQTWKIQGNWSNNAYNSNSGYTSGGVFRRGCIETA